MENPFLQSIYSDYETKVNSSFIYLRKLKNEIDLIQKNVSAWVSKLQTKYDTLNQFNKTRRNLPPAGDFALTTQTSEIVSDVNLKELELDIKLHSEQINHVFIKTERDMQFLVQTLQNMQDSINSIYDKYQELYEEIQS